MSTFDHDKLIAYVETVNPRTEKHGEESQLAIDVTVRVTKAENPGTWTELLDELIEDMDPVEAMETLDGLAESIKAALFVAEAAQQKVNFWQGNRKPASLTDAKINKVTWRCDKGAHYLTMRIQSEADGDQTGAICELLGQKIRLEIVSTQQELPLGERDDGDDGGDDPDGES